MPIALLVSIMPVYAAQNELPLVVVITSYNNVSWVEKNLDSIFMQQYNNFRVIYIDDCSSDGTADVVRKYIEDHNVQNQITFIANPSRNRKLKNVYNAFYLCDDNEIIIQVDGDDWLSHSHVFSEINSYYKKSNIWLTYGQFSYWYNSKRQARGWGHSISFNVKKSRNFRRGDYCCTHPKTFYAWLAKAIRLQDLLIETSPSFKGQFYPVANDVATFIPMLEMVGDKFAFISRTAYMVNCTNPISTSNKKKLEKNLQKVCCKEVRSQPIQYAKLHEPLYNRLEKFEHAKVNVVIIATDKLATEKLLTEMSQIVNGIENYIVLYDQDNSVEQLKESFDQVHFFDCAQLDQAWKYLTNCQQEHVILMRDSSQLPQSFDCTRHIYILEKTFADAVYENLKPKSEIPLQHLEDDIYAFKYLFADQKDLHEFNMVLYRKQQLLQVWEHAQPSSCAELIACWQQRVIGPHAIGLLTQDSEF